MASLRLPAVLLLKSPGCCLRCEGSVTTLKVLEATPGCVLALDGKPWRFPIGVAGPVKPGGESIDVESTLDSWGP